MPPNPLEDSTAAEERARARLAADPFCVPADVISLAQPEIWFALNQEGYLRAFLAHKSRARRLLESIRGVHFVKRDRAYYFPALQLSALIKQLRSRGVRFACEEQAGTALKETSALRRSYESDFGSLTANELWSAHLYPLLEFIPAVNRFRVVGWTTEQLRELVPESKDFCSRKAKASNLSPDEAGKVFLNSKRIGTPLALSREAKLALERYASSNSAADPSAPVPDGALACGGPPVCWVTLPGEGGGISALEAQFAPLLKPLQHEFKAGTMRKYAHAPGRVLVSWLESKLLQRYRVIQASLHAPATKSFNDLLAQLHERETALKRTQAFRAMHDAALDLHHYELASKLFPHQRVAVEWLLENPHGILGDDMGLGKTLSVLAAVEELKARQAVDRLLVICPTSLVRNWLREAAQWVALRLFALPETKAERLKFLRQLDFAPGIDGLVINYESARLEYVMPALQKFFSSGRHFLCIDESQRVKNPQSRSFRAINELADLFSHRVLLSGTPTPKDLADIWGQMMIVDRGARLGRRFFDWLPTVAELGNKYSDVAVKHFIPARVEETVARVHEVLLRRTKDEVLNLPEKIFSVRDIELTGEQQERYEEIRKDLLLRMRALNGETFVRSIDSVLEQYLRAVQVASNPRLIDESWRGTPAKFAELDDIVEEVLRESHEKIVIWTNYLRTVDDLVARYTAFGSAAFSGAVSPANRSTTIREFQNRQSGLRVLVAVPSAGGVGITLTAARTAVYLEKTWNAEHWMQSVDRLHRIGQTGTVHIISLRACKVDELIDRNLLRKQRNQEALVTLADKEGASELQSFPSYADLLSALSA